MSKNRAMYVALTITKGILFIGALSSIPLMTIRVIEGDLLNAFVVPVLIAGATALGSRAVDNLRLDLLKAETQQMKKEYQVIRGWFDGLIEQGILIETSPGYFQLTPKGKQTIEGTTNHE